MDKLIAEKILDNVKRNYDKISQDFEKSRRNLYWPEFEQFKPYFKNNQDVLDIGCAGGRLCKFLSVYRINYTGIDISRELIDLAKQRYGAENCLFFTGNLLDLDFLGEKQYDIIMVIGTFHHLPGKDYRLKALSQIKRHLKPGGYLLMTNWYFGLFRGLSGLISNLYNKFFFPYKKIGGIRYKDLAWRDLFIPWETESGRVYRYYHAFSKGELRRLFNSVGLETIQNYRYKNRNIISILKK